jgi:hypothetical protein
VYFDWREDAIYFAGSDPAAGREARYAAYLPDIAPGASFADTGADHGRAESLANYSAAIFVTPRGSSLGVRFRSRRRRGFVADHEHAGQAAAARQLFAQPGEPRTLPGGSGHVRLLI